MVFGRRLFLSLAACSSLLVGAFSGCGGSTDFAANSISALSEARLTTANDSIGKAGDEVAFQQEYQPINPDRENPFNYFGEYLHDEHPHPDGSSRTSVSGFAKTDTLRAILLIRGKSTALAVGESYGGVEVLAITPPTVQLKTSQMIWTASLFDRTPQDVTFVRTTPPAKQSL